MRILKGLHSFREAITNAILIYTISAKADSTQPLFFLVSMVLGK